MNELEALVILSRLPQLGSVKIRLLIEYFGSALNTLQADVEEIKALPGFGPKTTEQWKSWEKDGSWQENFELAQRHGIEIIPFNSPRYPQKLLELHDAPLLLYVRGEIKPRDQKSIAVVGTRNASRYGHEMAEKIAFELASMDFTVVSGLARGIDTTAHSHALMGGRTLAVIGSGLLNLYPRENLKLAEQIVQKGALISEFPLRTPPDRHNFPQRNRIVSGMTLGTVLIEAPQDSGAMITMKLAFNQGKKLFAVPGRAGEESFKGNLSLIKAGEALLVENGNDIAECFQDLFGECKKPPVFAREKLTLELEEEKLLERIPRRDLSFDEIAGLTHLTARQLNILLMGLVLKKAMKEYPGKIYKKVV